jgi:hypothetical protein
MLRPPLSLFLFSHYLTAIQSTFISLYQNQKMRLILHIMCGARPLTEQISAGTVSVPLIIRISDLTAFLRNVPNRFYQRFSFGGCYAVVWQQLYSIPVEPM